MLNKLVCEKPNPDQQNISEIKKRHKKIYIDSSLVFVMVIVNLENGVKVEVDVSDLPEEIINMEPIELLPQRPRSVLEGELGDYIPQYNGATRKDTVIGAMAYFEHRFELFKAA